jgi:arabinofuranosyltransferase
MKLDKTAYFKKTFNLYFNNKLNFIIFLLLLSIGIIFATINHSIIDDAYISFRYSNNLIEGNGLVYNSGEYVEGYSNFLWVIIIAFFMKFGFNPIIISKVLGILFFIGSLIFSYILSIKIFEKNTNKYIYSLIIISILVFNISLIHFATTGLEHSLFIFLLLFSSYFMFIEKNPFIGNFGLILLILTRNEGGLFFIFANVFYFLLINKHKILIKKHIYSFILSFLILLLYEIWRIIYYGSIFPNTFYAKATVTSLSDGFNYLYGFLISYPILILLIPFIVYSMFQKNKLIQFFVISSLLYMVYLVKMGGDFMAYRLITQIFPLLIISGIFGFVCYSRKYFKKINLKYLFFIIIFLLTFISFVFGEKYTEVSLDVDLLNIQKHSNWEEIGIKLYGLNFPENTSIAITAAGAIPYYSKLNTLDMLGLNDATISRQKQTNARPGHKKQATYGYLVEKQINFVVGHPQTMECNNACENNGYDWFMPLEVFKSQKVFIIMNQTQCFRMFYLTKNSELDNFLINHNDFKVCK